MSLAASISGVVSVEGACGAASGVEDAAAGVGSMSEGMVVLAVSASLVAADEPLGVPEPWPERGAPAAADAVTIYGSG